MKGIYALAIVAVLGMMALPIMAEDDHGFPNGPPYVVDFWINGENVGGCLFDEADAVASTLNPYKAAEDGYEFAGWGISPDSEPIEGSLSEFLQMFLQDTDLYAIYVPVGSGPDSNEPLDYSKAIVSIGIIIGLIFVVWAVWYATKR